MTVPLELLLSFLVASAIASSTVKLAGAVYLLYLGVQALTLVAIHVVVGLLWLSAYAHLVHQA